MEEMLKSTVQSAFSIVVAAYLLVRMEAKLEALTVAIANLQATLAQRASENVFPQERHP